MARLSERIEDTVIKLDDLSGRCYSIRRNNCDFEDSVEFNPIAYLPLDIVLLMADEVLTLGGKTLEKLVARPINYVENIFSKEKYTPGWIYTR